MKKKCPLHAPSSHGGAFMVLVHSGPVEAHIVRVGVTIGLCGHLYQIGSVEVYLLDSSGLSHPEGCAS
jgi:hypothetical protein